MAEAEALEICSRAMTLLSADSVVAFDDGTAESQVSFALYESTVQAALSEHRWSFAMMQNQATKLVAEPDNRFKLQYDLPSLLLVMDRIDPEHIDYELFARKKIYTNYDGEIWVEGLYRVDENDMPMYFKEYLDYRLAAKFAFPITGDKNLAAAMESGAEKFKRAAKIADSKQRKGVRIPSSRFSLITVRG